MSESNTDFVVIAPEGQQAFLNIQGHNFLINCHTPLNLTSFFTNEQLEKDPFLKANLEDGNLLRYHGEKLPEALKTAQIKPLKEISATKLEATYSQKTETNIDNYRVKTDTNVSSDIKSDIQTRVVKNREAILNTDKKFLKTHKTKNKNIVESSSRPQESGALDTDKLKMKVQMDISPSEFNKRQEASRQRLIEQEKVDKQRATAAIKDAEQKDNDLNRR